MIAWRRGRDFGISPGPFSKLTCRIPAASYVDTMAQTSSVQWCARQPTPCRKVRARPRNGYDWPLLPTNAKHAALIQRPAQLGNGRCRKDVLRARRFTAARAADGLRDEGRAARPPEPLIEFHVRQSPDRPPGDRADAGGDKRLHAPGLSQGRSAIVRRGPASHPMTARCPAGTAQSRHHPRGVRTRPASAC